jgi:putative molybdopterin biosynthesis protein
MAQAPTEFMNTRQAARYLNINEKKVYALAKDGKIPCTRVTGKWTFPRKLIDAWIEQSASTQLRSRELRPEPRPFLLAAGSDDPCLGVVRDLFEDRTKPGSFFLSTIGSSAGLAALRDGVADVAMAHLLDPASGQYNLSVVKNLFGAEAVVVELFQRELGLVVPAANPLKLRAISDLARPRIRMINRQPGSGTRLYLDHALAKLKITARRLTGYDTVVPTHFEVCLQVLRGKADTGLTTLAAARMLGLDFLPLARERFDAVIARERFFLPSVQLFLDIVASQDFRGRLDAMGGYECRESGRIISAN